MVVQSIAAPAADFQSLSCRILPRLFRAQLQAREIAAGVRAGHVNPQDLGERLRSLDRELASIRHELSRELP